MLRNQADCLGNVSELRRAVGPQTRDVLLSAHRFLNHGSFTSREVKGHAHDLQGKQKVGKDNGSVNTQRFRGSDRNFSSQRRILTDFYQGMILADGTIFGHVPSGLAHEPHGSAVRSLGLAGPDKA